MSNGKNLKEKITWPADLYVEGQDQFRGWFNSSLITSTIVSNKPPYKKVLSHGFVVDENGKKMSKSLGNVIDPEEMIEKFGSDVVRLWVVSSDFTKESKIGRGIIEKVRESYQKIRNTLRFLLSNLNDFEDISWQKAKFDVFDRFVLFETSNLVKESRDNYKSFNFNWIFNSILKFCNDLSSNYFEISKDVLYCERRDSERRKAKMKVLLHLLECIIEVIYPILPHLSEEAYQSSKLLRDKFLEKSISLVNFPSYENLPKINESEIAFVESLLSIKQSIYKELELSRKKGTIESNSQAEVEIRCTELTNEFLKKMDGINPESFFLVSNVNFLQSDTISESIKVEKTKKNKCKRCWNYRDLEKDFCLRCFEVIFGTWST